MVAEIEAVLFLQPQRIRTRLCNRLGCCSQQQPINFQTTMHAVDLAKERKFCVPLGSLTHSACMLLLLAITSLSHNMCFSNICKHRYTNRRCVASNLNEKSNAKTYIEWEIYAQPKPTGLQLSYQKGWTKDMYLVIDYDGLTDPTYIGCACVCACVCCLW